MVTMTMAMMTMMAMRQRAARAKPLISDTARGEARNGNDNKGKAGSDAARGQTRTATITGAKPVFVRRLWQRNDNK